MGDNTERSFIMVKPDGVHRGVVGEIIKRFEQRGYRLVAMKFVWVRDSMTPPPFKFYLFSCDPSVKYIYSTPSVVYAVSVKNGARLSSAN